MVEQWRRERWSSGDGTVKEGRGNGNSAEEGNSRRAATTMVDCKRQAKMTRNMKPSFPSTLLVILFVALAYDGGMMGLVDGAKCTSFIRSECGFGPDHGCFQACILVFKKPILDANCAIDGAGTALCECKFQC
ncbi:hypothetical protein DM860_011391 [Cuscuta australis]|uniref:Uncharacterized protein n=1 Tax=Cuscuta australis TaxID=267555 RepID=A0A328DQX0_9ASTE|nr:hypothetical protein DM860_011391 [Cuscuta australis]